MFINRKFILRVLMLSGAILPVRLGAAVSSGAALGGSDAAARAALFAERFEQVGAQNAYRSQGVQQWHDLGSQHGRGVPPSEDGRLTGAGGGMSPLGNVDEVISGSPAQQLPTQQTLRQQQALINQNNSIDDFNGPMLRTRSGGMPEDMSDWHPPVMPSVFTSARRGMPRDPGRHELRGGMFGHSGGMPGHDEVTSSGATMARRLDKQTRRNLQQLCQTPSAAHPVCEFWWRGEL
jgi:hypothetical protein